MNQLFLKLENGNPTGYPIIEDNLRQLVVKQLQIEITPEDLNDTGFVLFVPNDPPELPDRGTVFEVFVDGYKENADGSYSYRFDKRIKFCESGGSCLMQTSGNNNLAKEYLAEQLNNAINIQVDIAKNRLNSQTILPSEKIALEAYIQRLNKMKNQEFFPFMVTWPEFPGQMTAHVKELK
jgi:hypothetical protein